MTTLRDLHREAMAFAEQGDLAKRINHVNEAQTLYRRALELEKQAALELRDDYSEEPSRSVLFRSAATLAFDVGEWREAEKLVAMGLSGEPPHAIAEELHDVMDQISAIRHSWLARTESD